MLIEKKKNNIWTKAKGYSKYPNILLASDSQKYNTEVTCPRIFIAINNICTIVINNNNCMYGLTF